MHIDRHESIRSVVDKSLAGDASVQEEQALREHLLTCASCGDYLAASNRTISSLKEFCFEIDPELDGKVLASLAARVQQLDAEQMSRGRLWWVCFTALTLTAVGSFAASRIGILAAEGLHLQPSQIQAGLATLWTVPSLCFCLLFLLLPVLPVLRMNKKGTSQ